MSALSQIPWWGWILIAVAAAWLLHKLWRRIARPADDDDPFQHPD